MQDKTQYLEEVLNKYDGITVPVPESWGGFRLLPTYFDFVDINVSYSQRVCYELRTSPIGNATPAKSLQEHQPWKVYEKMP